MTVLLSPQTAIVAVGSLGSLLNPSEWLQLPHQRVAAVMDYSRGSWTRSWNSGILLLKPDAVDSERIHGLLMGLEHRNETIPAVDGDQSFLNWCAAHTNQRLLLSDAAALI